MTIDASKHAAICLHQLRQYLEKRSNKKDTLFARKPWDGLARTYTAPQNVVSSKREWLEYLKVILSRRMQLRKGSLILLVMILQRRRDVPAQRIVSPSFEPTVMLLQDWSALSLSNNCDAHSPCNARLVSVHVASPDVP